MDYRQMLVGSFRAAVAGADPAAVVKAALPAAPRGRTLVVGAGKAAAAMAAAMEDNWPAQLPLSGLVVTRDGHGLPLRRISLVEASHPVPDARGVAAAAKMIQLAAALGPDDLMLVLISGGGSALLPLPAAGLTLGDVQEVTTALLRSGARIQDMNTVRKHLSGILGGRLAAATRAHVEVLVVSDVVGDDLASIASGPCSPDPSTYAEAEAIIRRRGLALPPRVAALLEKGRLGQIPESPKPGDAVFRRVSTRLIASSNLALEAARAHFARLGIPAVVIGDAVTGEAREVARAHAALALRVARHGEPWRSPMALLSGGECTVSVKASGRGGRCTEYLLGLCLALGEMCSPADLAGMGIWALACDTDGIDGTEDNAGALVSPDTLARAAELGLDAQTFAAGNDAWGYFNGLGDLVVSGPTLTNVNDYRVMLVAPGEGGGTGKPG